MDSNEILDLLKRLDGHVPHALLCINSEGSVVAAALPEGSTVDVAAVEGRDIRDLVAKDSKALLFTADHENWHQQVQTLAHELRNPLTTLRGYAALLEREFGNLLDDIGRGYLDRLSATVDRVQSQIEQLLEQSRLLACACQPSLESPNALIQRIAAELKPELERGGIELVLPASPPAVYADPSRLNQVILNLVLNAIQHMGDVASPRIEILAQTTSAGTWIEVSDNGLGLPPSEQIRIQELFDCARSGRDWRSTGLGLSIVKRILAMHGGRVEVESTPDEGTMFRAFFPHSTKPDR